MLKTKAPDGQKFKLKTNSLKLWSASKWLNEWIKWLINDELPSAQTMRFILVSNHAFIRVILRWQWMEINHSKNKIQLDKLNH